MATDQLNLANMTTPQKLHLLETIWEDLLRSEREIPSPNWHREVLEERERKISSGEESFVDWDTAKVKLRESLRHWMF